MAGDHVVARRPQTTVAARALMEADKTFTTLLQAPDNCAGQGGNADEYEINT
jgi:hypothetical protein